MQEKGAISGSMEITNLSLFRELNNTYSRVARDKYGVANQDDLFKSETKTIKRPGPVPNYREDGMLVLKAIPNDDMFSELQKKHDEYHAGTSFKQKQGTEGSAASPKTIAMVKDFLKRIGVDVKAGKEIIVDGRRLDDNAIAEITKNLIQVLEGKEASSLTEEAMHFAVEIIEQTNPALFNKLLGEINNYRLYNEVFAEYSLDSDYQTKDGKPDVRKIKKEAIGKLLAEVVINQSEGLTEKPELLDKVEQSWWKTFIEWLKGLVVKSGFDQAAMDIITGKNIGTAADIRAEEGSFYKQKSTQSDLYDKLKATKSSLTRKEDGYYIGDKKIPMRVSDLVDKWYERRFRSKELIKSDYQKAVDDVQSECILPLQVQEHIHLDTCHHLILQ
jgi:hypothetical protein